MNSKNLIAVIIVAAIVFGGGGFYGGMTYQKSQMPSFGSPNGQGGLFMMNGGGGPGGPGGGPGGGGNDMRKFFTQGGRPVGGEIISQDDKSITIKMHDGSTKIVMLSSKTEINKSTTGSKDDLKNGEQVMAVGTENSDGSISANMISIGGRFANFGGFGRSQPSQQPQQSQQ